MVEPDKRNKNGIILYALLIVFFCIFIAPAPHACAQADTCVTADCHARMGKDNIVHGPVKDGACYNCHQITQEPVDKKVKHPGNLTITLKYQGSGLCYLCHKPKNTKKAVHAPTRSGDCLTCHDPHQASNKGLLRDAVPNICFQCHPDGMMKHKTMHSPVAAGDCSGCHYNHQSDFSGMLVQEGNTLCFTCHQNKQEGLMAKKIAHLPAKQSCVQCHNPHGSANKAMLSEAVPELCSNCHPNEAALSIRAITKHGPMIDSKTCINCHDPHFSDFSKLLTSGQTELCLGCHNKELVTESGGIKDLKSFLEANKGGQGPLRGKSCVTCHNPHGSDYWRLLIKYYVPSFYTSYSDGKYGLCFSCHSRQGFIDRRTNKATNFRDGNKNLHFVHVNKADKGRTCRTCHDACAECQSAGLPRSMKEFVDFNGWKMPLNYSPSASGGTCAPGCHEEKLYSR